MAETISLLNMKGGVGKTTLAVTLASHAYDYSRKRVLLVDFDPQFNASQYLMSFEAYQKHVKQHGTIANLLIEQPALRLTAKPRKPSAKNCIVRLAQASGGTRYLDFLPAELALAHVVKNPHQMDFKLEKILDVLRPNYDYVFIDCAPTDSVLTTMALTASTFILVPVKPDRFSILGFGNLLETVSQFRENSSNPNDVRELGIVFTMVSDDSPIDRECMAAVGRLAGQYKWHVFSSRVAHSRTFQRAIRDQTAPMETKWARRGLKSSLATLAREMESRIAAMRKG